MDALIERVAVPVVIVLLAAVVLLLIGPQLSPALEQTIEALENASYQPVTYFKPGSTATGTIPAENVAKGYEQTELSYQVSVLGIEKCEGLQVGLRLTGYGWQRKKIDECTHGAVVTAFEELFRQLVEKFRGNTPLEQAQIEDSLFDKFMWDLPDLIAGIK